MLIGEVNRNFRLPDNSVVGLSSRIMSVDLGIIELTNADLVAAIRAGKPCILCTVTHMMVVTALHYLDRGPVVEIVGATVMDPFHPGGFRPALETELVVAPRGQLRFFAIPEFLRPTAPSRPAQSSPPGVAVP